MYVHREQVDTLISKSQVLKIHMIIIYSVIIQQYTHIYVNQKQISLTYGARAYLEIIKNISK